MNTISRKTTRVIVRVLSEAVLVLVLQLAAIGFENAYEDEYEYGKVVQPKLLAPRPET